MALTTAIVLWSCQNIGALAISVDEATDDTFQKHGIEWVEAGGRAKPSVAGSNSFTYKPVLNVPDGTSYVIITDHTDPACLSNLNRLTQFHSGKILQIKNFRNLCK
ncbi:MAG: hypothetical protein ACRD3W_32095, partial [Terriglobales bacterium]